MTESFDTYVIQGLLAKEFGITSVADLTSLRSIYFIKDQYTEIEKLISSKDIKRIKELPENSINSEFKEFLEIMTFKDQHLNSYIVTVYDSTALEQDPQIIKIYPLDRKIEYS